MDSCWYKEWYFAISSCMEAKDLIDSPAFSFIVLLGLQVWQLRSISMRMQREQIAELANGNDANVRLARMIS